MGVSLVKGGNISLTKASPGLTNIAVGLGWDARSTTGTDFDLDSSVFMVNDSGAVPSTQHFVYFNNLTSPEGSVVHQGDNLTGAGEGDDEVVKIDLTQVPAEVVRLAFAVTIYEAEKRNQNFGMVQNAFIRIVNETSGEELARYDLAEDFSMETAMIFGEVYRYNEEWKFKAVGQGFSGGLQALVSNFGVG